MDSLLLQRHLCGNRPAVTVTVTDPLDLGKAPGIYRKGTSHDEPIGDDRDREAIHQIRDCHASGRCAMSPGSGPVSGADAAYLLIGSDSVSVGCDLHPDFTQSCGFDEGRRVPATWVVSVLAGHLKVHPVSAQDPSAEEPVNPRATAVSQLDTFGQTVAAQCRWAMDHNGGDPSSTWPVPVQLAVAIVLGNHVYLSGMGDGPGYSPQHALMLLYQGMAHPPADVDAWIQAIRMEIRQPGREEHGGLSLPPTQLRIAQ